MERGFTLVELLAVIVVIALISIIAFPSVLNQFTKSKGSICVSFDVLVDNGNLKEPIKNLETGRNMDLATNGVQVTYHADTKVINEGVVGGLTSLDCDVKITN